MADAAGRERAGVLERDGPEVERPGRHDQLLAALRLELAPALQGALGEPDVVLIGVRESEDARAAVARAAVVARLELLHEQHAAARLRERACRRDAGDSGPDHDDVGVARHAARPYRSSLRSVSGLSARRRGRAFVAARASAL